MRSEAHFSITLPGDMADLVEEKVRSGVYGSVSDVLHAGISALLEQDNRVERWLQDEVLPGHAEYLDDPTKAVPAENILSRIRERRQASSVR